MGVNVIADQGKIDDVKAAFSGVKNAVPRVLSRAINKTLVTTRAKAAQEIGQNINLKAADIKASFRDEKATVIKPEGASISMGMPVPLIQFVGTRELARGGVSVKVKKTGSRVILRHAFIRTMESGHRGVFERAKQLYKARKFNVLFPYARLPREMRLPIEELFSLRIQDEYSKDKIMNVVLFHAGEAYSRNLDHEMSYELSKL